MKILIVDDHAIVRDGLRRMLEVLADTSVIEAANGRDALTVARAERPELIILDLNLPGLGGLELINRLMLDDRARRILVLSMHAEPLYAVRALEAGATGYLSKNASPDELIEAVRRVSTGGRYVEADIAQAIAVQGVEAGEPMGRLSARDLEILRLLAAGASLAEIADALGVGYKTVANTCSQIKTKLGLARTADLVRFSVERGVG
eukprot:gene17907-18139_t